ncbi:MAG TPA: response regulator [Burkholderiaceae bacterium]|nr:response regulator [Burkholderiaceae bacterium]
MTSVRVLLVDDNRDAADSLAQILKFDGHTVEVAYDGAMALEAVARFNPDVVLLDIGLPGLNGYEVARRIRASEGGRRIRLIAITGWGQATDERNAYDAGFDTHMVKPVDYDELAAHLAPR